MIDLLAQAEFSPQSLVQYGALGVVLAWFMFRNDRRLESLEKSNDLTTRSNLHRLLADQELIAALREQVVRLAKELEDKDRTK